MILKTRILDHSCSAIFFLQFICKTILETASSTYTKVTVKMDNTDFSISKSLAMTLKPNTGSPPNHFKLGDLSADFSRPDMQVLLEFEKRRNGGRGRYVEKRLHSRGFTSMPVKPPSSYTHKTFSSIIHDAQLEALLILKCLCKSGAQGIRRQYLLTATLKLIEDTLVREQKES